MFDTAPAEASYIEPGVNGSRPRVNLSVQCLQPKDYAAELSWIKNSTAVLLEARRAQSRPRSHSLNLCSSGWLILFHTRVVR